MTSESLERSRRALEFTSFREVQTDIERLHRGGYQSTGEWDLAQVCGHLAEWMRFPLDGFPMRSFPWVFRTTIGRWVRNRILRKRAFPVGIKSPLPATILEPGGDVEAAIANLRRIIDRFERHEGDYLPSPVFGTMTREQWTQFQLIHCAHHLSFLVPQGEAN